MPAGCLQSTKHFVLMDVNVNMYMKSIKTRWRRSFKTRFEKEG